MTKCGSFCTGPRRGWGLRRCERIIGDFRRAAEILVMSEDLPTLGIPKSPTSAISFNSSRIHFSSPGSPVWRTGSLVGWQSLKRAFPCPPRPPFSSNDFRIRLSKVGQNLARFRVL